MPAARAAARGAHVAAVEVRHRAAKPAAAAADADADYLLLLLLLLLMLLMLELPLLLVVLSELYPGRGSSSSTSRRPSARRRSSWLAIVARPESLPPRDAQATEQTHANRRPFV